MTVRKLASDIMDFADRRGYGLGECRWNLNKNALDMIEECDAYIGFDDAYDSTPKEENDRCTGDHAAHIKAAKKLASEAYDLACTLDDMGVTNFE